MTYECKFVSRLICVAILASLLALHAILVKQLEQVEHFDVRQKVDTSPRKKLAKRLLLLVAWESGRTLKL